jgi:hypothetical protein
MALRDDAAASTASRPNVRDDGQRPSLARDRTARLLALICPTRQAEYFCSRHWTEQKRDLPVEQHKRLWVRLSNSLEFSGERCPRARSLRKAEWVSLRPALNSGPDCRDSYTISYSREESLFCGHIRKNGQPSDAVSRCNSDPARGWLSVEGILYSYDRLGVVRLDSKFVGQLMLP